MILTPAAERGQGMVRKAAELAQKHGWFLARQFENPANPAYHRNTTGPEIIQDFVGKRLDNFVTGWGTGGTLTGVGEVLKLARPDVKIIATRAGSRAVVRRQAVRAAQDPGLDAGLRAGRAQQERPRSHRAGDRRRSHRGRARAGAAAKAFSSASRAARTFAAALKVAREAGPGSVTLAMLPDTGERYLSTALFEGIADGGDPEPS